MKHVDEQGNEFRDYSFTFTPPGPNYDSMTPRQVSEEVDRQVQEHMRRTGQKDYSVALHHILDGDPQLLRAYAEVPGLVDSVGDLLDQVLGKGKRQAPLRRDRSIRGVADEVDAKVQEWLKKNGSEDYQKALREVLAADPDLKARYSRGY